MEKSADQEKKATEEIKEHATGETGTAHHETKDHSLILKHVAVLIFILLLFVLVVGVNVTAKRNLRKQLAESQRLADTLRLSNDEKNEKIEELESRDSEQDKELAAMSRSLTAKSDELTAMQEKEAARYIPNIYPLRGAASLLQEDPEIPDEEETDEEEPEDEETETDEDAVPLVIPPDAPYAAFMTAAESRAIATADGTVTKVSGDADKGYQIVLDHGNGYITVYEGFGLALVSENDIVGRGSVLLYFVDETNRFTYRMQYGENWVDPLELIDING